jgi:hypothetical protein
LKKEPKHFGFFVIKITIKRKFTQSGRPGGVERHHDRGTRLCEFGLFGPFLTSELFENFKCSPWF